VDFWIHWRIQSTSEVLPTTVLSVFAEKLAKLIPPVAVRLRRDFPTILTLIKANAVLHQATRRKDPKGQIVADFQDYEVVRDLVSEAIGSQVDATVPDTVRQTVEAVTSINGKSKQPVSISELKRELKLDKSTISRRVKDALKRDYLQNEEKYRGRPFKLVPGDPLPARTEILPATEVLRPVADRCPAVCNSYPIDEKEDVGKCCSVAVEKEGISAPLSSESVSGAKAYSGQGEDNDWIKESSRRLQDIKRRREAQKEIVYV